jgi:2,4-dienoyl-CoA reductase-like NADH-dependent reductase (Old Yellow Enzyme family)
VDSSRLSDQLYIKHWKEWAQSCKSPTIVQINHPGRQSPAGAGSRGFFRKTVAPSPVALDFGSGLVQTLLRQLIFGTPRELTTHEVTEVINQFVVAAKHVYDSGFDGVEIHAAHGYLLAQFLSTQTNQRSDEFGGSAYDRAEIIVRIVRGIRVATSPSFCIGMKLNSVDASQSGGSNEDFVEQLKRFGDAGIDFLEISGGTYETPDVCICLVHCSRKSTDDRCRWPNIAQRALAQPSVKPSSSNSPL